MCWVGGGGGAVCYLHLLLLMYIKGEFMFILAIQKKKKIAMALSWYLLTELLELIFSASCYNL